MELISLVCKFKTHEMERRAREEKSPQNKKILAFKSTLTISDKNDEDLFLLVKNVRRMYSNTKFENRIRWQGKEKKKLICYNY